MVGEQTQQKTQTQHIKIGQGERGKEKSKFPLIFPKKDENIFSFQKKLKEIEKNPNIKESIDLLINLAVKSKKYNMDHFFNDCICLSLEKIDEIKDDREKLLFLKNIIDTLLNENLAEFAKILCDIYLTFLKNSISLDKTEEVKGFTASILEKGHNSLAEDVYYTFIGD